MRLTFLWVLSSWDEGSGAALETYARAIGSLSVPSELIVVSDGLPDESIHALVPLARRSGLPSSLLRLHRRGGEAAAVAAAAREARGEYVVILPEYLQVDPDAIRPLVHALLAGELDYVASHRSPRVDPRGDRTRSAVFNWLSRRLTGIALHDLNSTLRGMRRAVLEEVPLYGNLFRFLPVLAMTQGFRVGELKVRHLEERLRREESGPGAYLQRVLDLITLFFLVKFTRKPLRFFGVLGTALLVLGLVVLTVIVVERLHGRPLADRPMLIYGILMVVLGVQLFCIGLIGELIIFHHAQDVSEYKVECIYESSGS